jgi:hypothetical protein
MGLFSFLPFLPITPPLSETPTLVPPNRISGQETDIFCRNNTVICFYGIMKTDPLIEVNGTCYVSIAQ